MSELYHFKLVLKPDIWTKNEKDRPKVDQKKVEALKRYLEDVLNAQKVKAYQHCGSGRELINLIFTFNTRKDALAYHNYISDRSNYSGYIYPDLKGYFLRSGKLKIS